MFYKKISNCSLKISLLAFLFKAVLLPAQATLASTGLGLDFSPVIGKAKPAVVSINVYVKQNFNNMEPTTGNPLMDQFLREFYGITPDRWRQYNNRGANGNGGKVLRQLGSGVIFDVDEKGGYILSNNHVISGGDIIEAVLVDGRKIESKVVGVDPQSDVALIKIDAPNLKGVEIGDSEKIKEGNVVFAIGNPLGIGISVSMGIVSALSRKVSITERDNFIQTDAAINRGNSGGPLIDINGNLVGINVAILSQSGGSEGIGFAIPINQAMRSVAEIKKYGRVKAPWLGVSMQDITEELVKNYGVKEGEGVLIIGVQPGSPADQAGIKRNDVIVEVNGKAVGDKEALRGMIQQLGVGDSVEIELLRKKKKIKVSAKIGENDTTTGVAQSPSNGKNEKSNSENLLAGIRVEENNYINAMYGIRGVKIKELSSQSYAARVGLQVGDVILEISDDGQDISLNSADDFNTALKEFKGEKELQLLVERGGAVHVLVLTQKQ